MADMNVKGGYFAPSNYLKVNEGGSHEENPNGGVQIGVDQNGTPNMLEEGEPVYNDFVYSDNIIADAEFLEKHNLPKKYEGWLYSRIADDLFDEYSATPLDPISKNGADVMLTRLAECQEEQKMDAEQKELEQLYSELSPEEQEALGQLLAQSAQQPSPEEMAMAQQQAMPQEQIPAEAMQATPEQMALPGQEASVMAACGGKINRYDDGGERGNLFSRMLLRGAFNDPYSGAVMQSMGWENDPVTGDVVQNDFNNPGSEYLRNALALDALVANGAMGAGMVLGEAPSSVVANQTAKNLIKSGEAAAKTAKSSKNIEEAGNAVKNAQGLLERKTADRIAAETALKNAAASGDANAIAQAEALYKNSMTIENTAKTMLESATNQANIAKAAASPNKLLQAGKWIAGKYKKLPGVVRGAIELAPFAGTIKGIVNYANNQDSNNSGYDVVDEKPVWGGEATAANPMTKPIVTKPAAKGYDPYEDWAFGGQMNSYKNGSGGPVFEPTTKYFLPDEYAGPTLSKIGTVSELPYRSFNGPTITGNAPKPRTSRSASVLAGKMPEVTRPIGNPLVSDGQRYLEYSELPQAMATYDYSPLVDNRAAANAQRDVFYANYNGDADGYNALATWPRYAGAFGSGLRLLNNVIQPADEYNTAYYHPEQIYNNLPLIDPRFNPIDVNMTENSVINQSNATARALINSGAGGSTPAALIAADSVANANRGAARAQDLQMNEQLYNQALSGTNSNAAARSQNDMAVDRYNAQSRMDSQYRNIPLALQMQMLNNQAEAQKYAAIGQEARNLEYALQGIGRENFIMNQINSNPAFENYSVSPYGVLNYMANLSEDGGFIKKIKKTKK